MTLLDKIVILCGERRMSLRQVEKEAGLTPRTIQHWNTSTPSADKVVRVANALMVPVEELLSVYDPSGNLARVSKISSQYGEVTAIGLPEREQGILFCFRLLNDKGQEMAEEYLNMLLEGEKYRRYPRDTNSKDA